MHRFKLHLHRNLVHKGFTETDWPGRGKWRMTMAKRVYAQKIVTIERQIDTAIAMVNQNISFLSQHIEGVAALSEIENPTPSDLHELENFKKSVANCETMVSAAKEKLAALQAKAPDYISGNTVWAV